MSSPQQPWSQPGPSGPSSGYGAPQGYQGQQPQGYPVQPPGPGNQPQGYGQPAPAAYGGPTGELVLNLTKPFGAMGMISPVVTIDGYPAGSQWGRNSFRVPAGVRRVEVAQTYLWTYGRAAMPVTVEPGATSEIYYSGPMATFMGGAIGTAPQTRPGRGVFIGLMVVVALCLLVGVLAAVVGNS